MALPPETGKEENANWPNKRLRAHVACEACRKRKIRCDSNKPTCFNCVRSDIPCVYPLDGRRKRGRVAANPGPSEPPGFREISHRLSRVEALLEALVEQRRTPGSARRRSSGNSIQDEDVEADNDEDEDEEDCDDEKAETESAENENENGNDDSNRTPTQVIASDLDLLHLAYRRSPVVIKLGDGEPLVLYTHGFIPSLLNPGLMRRLCEKIGSAELGKNTEERLTLLWRRKMEMTVQDQLDIGEPLQPLGRDFVQQCMDLHARDTSDITKLLINQGDIELVGKMCCPQGDLSKIDYSNPYSLLYNTVIMQFTGPNSPLASQYSSEFLNEMNLAAFKVSIRAYVPCCHPTFLLMRLMLFNIMVLYRMTFFPRLRSLIAITLSMAYDLGLHRSDGSRLLTAQERQRRALVWMVLQDFDVRLSASLSCIPLSLDADWCVDTSEFNIPEGRDLQALMIASKLNKIYTDVFTDLFSQRAQKYSVKVMMDKLCKLVERLDAWFKELPESSKRLLRKVEAGENAINAMFSVITDNTPGGTSASGTSAFGTSAFGTSANGTSANGTSANGTSANGTPANGTPANGTSANGTSANSTSANGSQEGRLPSGSATSESTSDGNTPATHEGSAASDTSASKSDGKDTGSNGYHPTADTHDRIEEDDPHCFSWQFSRQHIESNTLTCYYQILILVHSVPAFSPSCLKVYDEIPSSLSDSLNILDNSAKQILRLAFSRHGLQCLGYLPLVATNAFSALFLKQIRDRRHCTNGEDLVLIYQYIFRFRKIISGKLTRHLPGLDLVLGLWLNFASVLTQLNKEWLRDADQRVKQGQAPLQEQHLHMQPSAQREQAQVQVQDMQTQQVGVQQVHDQHVQDQQAQNQQAQYQQTQNQQTQNQQAQDQHLLDRHIQDRHIQGQHIQDQHMRDHVQNQVDVQAQHVHNQQAPHAQTQQAQAQHTQTQPTQAQHTQEQQYIYQGQQPVYVPQTPNVPFYQPHPSYMPNSMLATSPVANSYSVPVDRSGGQDNTGYAYNQEPMSGLDPNPDEFSLWDMFNDQNGIEVDIPDLYSNPSYDAGNGGNGEYSNCIVA